MDQISPLPPDLAIRSCDVGAVSRDLDTQPPPRRRLHGLSAPRQAGTRLRTALIEHVGGAPSAVELALIDSLAELKVKLSVFDRRFVEEGGMSAHARREYLAFANTYGRLLRQLGRKAAVPPAPTLHDYLASRAAANATTNSPNP